MAMDHRDSFGRTLFGVVDDRPTDEQRAAMQRAKQLIYSGLLTGSAGVPDGRPGVLVDEQYGQAVIDEAADGRAVLAVPIEASGRDWFELLWGSHWLEHVQAIGPAYAKVLVRDNPEFPAGARRDQLHALAEVGSALAGAGVGFLYELLLPPTDDQLAAVGGDHDRYDRELRPALTVQVIADNQDAGVEPDLWKVEGLETVEAARSVAAQARAGGRAADLIVLGRDAPVDRVDHWLWVAAQVDEFVGFAIGRSTWEDPLRDWSDHLIDDSTVVNRIAIRYRSFVDHWHA